MDFSARRRFSGAIVAAGKERRLCVGIHQTLDLVSATGQQPRAQRQFQVSNRGVK